MLVCNCVWQRMAMTSIPIKETPALNALKALRGTPTSMGRGEIPVGGSQPPSVFAIFNIVKQQMQELRLRQFLHLLFTFKNICNRQMPETEDKMYGNKIGLTIEEAAEYTGIGRDTIRRLVEWEKLPVLRIGRKSIIRTDTIERCKQSSKVHTWGVRTFFWT